MKRLLPALLLCLLALGSCKKEQPAATPITPIPPVTTTPVTPYQATISNISPTSGTPGTVVTISGTNFGTYTTVSFSGVTGLVQSTTATEIKVIVPQSTSGNVSVTANNQTVTGPEFTYAVPVITGILPTSGTSGTVVTITGTNLGTSNSGAQLLFNGVVGSIQSITPTEIKAVVPVTKTGNVTLVLGKQSGTGPIFTYSSVFTAPYISGDVILTTQAEVDGFVNQNKGRTLQIVGNLGISGADITSVSGLSNITSVSGKISLSACPLLTDIFFLNNITAAGSLSFQTLVATAITMDKLTGSTETIFVSACKNLNSLSVKSLTGVTGGSIPASVMINSCEQLSHIDFGSLVSTVAGLTISSTAIADLSGFNSLQTAGALTLSSNLSLLNFHGLEHLINLTKPALSSFIATTVINGLYISGNPKLTSLSGLQNLNTAPVARIISNTTLNDFCPMKALITTLSTTAPYTYKTSTNIPEIYKTVSVPALSLTNNSGYATTADALAAVKLCN